MGNTIFLRKLRGCLENCDLEYVNNCQPVRKGKIDLTTGLICFEDGSREVMNLKPDNDRFIPTEDNTKFKLR